MPWEGFVKPKTKKMDELLNESYDGEEATPTSHNNEMVGRDAPSNDSERIREISIRELNRGFIVNVGCHSFAISTSDELIRLITDYIKSPSDTEYKWFNGELLKR